MREEWILAGRFVVDSGLLVLIWIVQTIIYPSFRFVEAESFVAWHARYTRRIGFVVAPLMLLQLGLILWSALISPVVGNGVQLILCLCVWATTYFYSVKCHNRLAGKGKDLEVINRLVITNWLRTVAWSAIWLLHTGIWIAF